MTVIGQTEWSEVSLFRGLARTALGKIKGVLISGVSLESILLMKPHPPQRSHTHLGLKYGVHLFEHLHVDLGNTIPSTLQSSDWCGAEACHHNGHHRTVVS